MKTRSPDVNQAPEQRFIGCFRLAARQVGSVARHLQGRVKAQKKSGHGSPEGEALTAVDLAAQEIILHALLDALPEAAVDAEEDTALLDRFPAEDGRRPVVIVDPIDGTLNYIRESRDYAVMAALSAEGYYRAAVVHFPAYGEMLWAMRGEGCWRQTGAEPPRRVTVGNLPRTVLVTPAVPAEERAALEAIGLSVRQSRCSAVDASAPANGAAAASVAVKRAGRRRAVGFLLTLEAGGVVRHAGKSWQGEDPGTQLAPVDGSVIVAASAELADRIAAALQRG